MSERRKHALAWDDLFTLSTGQAGYFTKQQACRLGFSDPVLSYHQRKGKIVRAFSRVYRFAHYPITEHEELVVAWLASEGQGVFSHETALALHDLSDVLPDRLHMTLPATWRRRQLPAQVDRFYDVVPDADIVWVGPVPATSPTRTLGDCAAVHVSPEVLSQAVAQARARGILSPSQPPPPDKTPPETLSND